jgi:tetratricopeptide (TPR) repeat protein
MPSQRPQIKAKTLALLARAEETKPLTTGLLLSLADQFEGAGESAKAAQLYLRLLKEANDMPALREHLRAKLAEIYLRDSDHQRATEQLQAILRDDPANSIAYFYLGTIASDEKKPAEAIEHFRKVILLTPDFEPAYYDLAGAQLSLDKSTDAIETLQAARKRFPQSFALEYWLGMAYSQQKAHAEAIRHYSTAEIIAAATDPKRLDRFFYFQLGAAHERNQDYDQAEKCFRRSLELAPDFAESQNYLGYMWAERGIKLDEARELIEKAVKAQPKNAAYLDSLGWVLFRLNQPKAALEHLLKASELLTEPDPTVWDHLGDVYDALNQPDKAREAWEKSIQLESNDAIRKKLEHQGHK